MNEISKQDQANDSTALMLMIERVCLSPDADIAKLEKMLDMQERVLDRNARQAFTADLASMQIELPRIVENGKGHNSAKYALLEDINDAVRPVLNKFGFAVTFSIDQTERLVTVVARLSHKMGFSEETRLSLPLDTSGNKNPVQAAGSTISYGKRYAICALLNISTGEDVDGGLPVQRQQRIPQKEAINDERLVTAIAKINAGEYTAERLNGTFALTTEQSTKVSNEVKKA